MASKMFYETRRFLFGYLQYSHLKNIFHKIAELMRGEPRYSTSKFLAQLAFTSLLIHKEKINWL